MTRLLGTTISNVGKVDIEGALLAVASCLVPGVPQGDLIVANVLEGAMLKEDPNTQLLLRLLTKGSQGLRKTAAVRKVVDLVVDTAEKPEHVVDKVFDAPELGEFKPPLIKNATFKPLALFAEIGSTPSRPSAVFNMVPEFFSEAVNLQSPVMMKADFRALPGLKEFFEIRSRQGRIDYLKNLAAKDKSLLYRLALLIPTYDGDAVSAVAIDALAHSGYVPQMKLFHYQGRSATRYKILYRAEVADIPTVAITKQDGVYRDVKIDGSINLKKATEIEYYEAPESADIFFALATSMHRQGLTKCHPAQMGCILRLIAALAKPYGRVIRTEGDEQVLGEAIPQAKDIVSDIEMIVDAATEYEKGLRSDAPCTPLMEGRIGETQINVGLHTPESVGMKPSGVAVVSAVPTSVVVFVANPA
eukprot:Blabericola_migrator_1__9@NODE_1003_length_5730_cov_34_006357_g690_i0_p1_GENE_NODE_1003_length_5730_cov_34_006357_g690_i0NODE_1003_length_5730_cov_34_006357_g690_i0_p1_ORF_typecomplete_len417_score84_68_NODE_1003_length_5730_cov_34_006357_g690_i020333283